MTYRMTVAYSTPADPESFDAHYDAVHVPLCRALPGLVSVSLSRPRPLGPGVAPYLVAELDFDSLEDFKAAMRSPEMAAVAADAEGMPAERAVHTGEVTSLLRSAP